MAATASDAATVKIQTAYGKLPLHFEANQGQTDEQVQFLSRGDGYSLFLTPTEAVLALRNAERGMTDTDWKTISTSALHVSRSSFSDHHSAFPTGTVLRMQLVGANPQPQVAGLEEFPGKVNYLLGSDPKQ